jgi:hypothetical protein
MVRRYVERLRQQLNALAPEERLHMLQAKRVFKMPSVRQAGAWLLKNPQDLTPAQDTFIRQLCEINPDVKVVHGPHARLSADDPGAPSLGIAGLAGADSAVCCANHARLCRGSAAGLCRGGRRHGAGVE